MDVMDKIDIIDKMIGYRYKINPQIKITLMRPKFQKLSALKFDGRIIPEARPCGINLGLISF